MLKMTSGIPYKPEIIFASLQAGDYLCFSSSPPLPLSFQLLFSSLLSLHVSIMSWNLKKTYIYTYLRFFSKTSISPWKITVHFSGFNLLTILTYFVRLFYLWLTDSQIIDLLSRLCSVLKNFLNHVSCFTSWFIN